MELQTPQSGGGGQRSSMVPLVTFYGKKEVNPFRNRTPKPTCIVYLRRLFVAFTLLPIRIVGLLILLFFEWLFAKIAICGLSKEDYHSLKGKQLAPWRRFFASSIWPLGRIGLCLMGFWWIPKKGECADHAEAPIIVGNHTSGLVDGAIFSSYAKLAEGSYAEMPIASTLGIAVQNIFVDRKNPESRQQARQALTRRCEEPGWPQTVIFPEGTCTNGLALVQFKTGAFAPGKPVQPVLLRYSPSPFGNFDTSFTCPMNMGTYFLGMLLQIANFLEVEFLPVVVPTEEEKKDEVAFANRVQRIMADALDIPCTKHSGEDLMLAMQAEKMGMPFKAGLVKWQALTEDLSGLRVKGALKILEQFKTLRPDAKGEVDFETFAEVMGKVAQEPIVGADGTEAQPTKPSEHKLRQLFDTIDRHGTGKINFEEYLSTAAAVNGFEKEDRAAGWEMAWNLHAGGKSTVTKEQALKFNQKVLPQITEEGFEKAWSRVKLDQSGMLTKAAFIEFAMKNHQEYNVDPTMYMAGIPMALEEV